MIRISFSRITGLIEEPALKVAALAMVLGAAFWFRMYPAWVFPNDLAAAKGDAIAAVKLKNVFEQKIRSNQPQWGEAQIREAVLGSVRQALVLHRNDVKDILRSSRKEAADLPSTRSVTRYLLESDPYYYLNLTRQILADGMGSIRFSGRLYYNPLMNAPEGLWYPFDLNPLVGAVWTRLLWFFNSGIPIEDAVRWIPILVTGCAAGVFWLVARKALRLGFWPSLTGLAVFLVSPIYLKRSLLGWYDTDPYNVLFAVALFGCLIRSVAAEGRRKWIWSAGTGLCGALFSLFWRGWLFPFLALVLITNGIAALAGITSGIGRPKKIGTLTEPVITVVWAISFALIGVGVLWRPEGLRQEWVEFSRFIAGFFAPSLPLRPDLLVTIGELKPADPAKINTLLGGSFLLPIAFVGWAAGVVWHREKSGGAGSEALKTACLSGFLLLAVSLVLTSRMERFALFALPFTALGIAVFYSLLPQMLDRFFKFVLIPEAHPKVAFVPMVAATLAAALFSVPLTLNADRSVRKFYPILNPAWEEALLRVKTHTPTDSVVATWWSPGHFIAAVGNRRTLWDGATQDLPKSYWIATALLAGSDQKAGRILDMLASSGTQAEDFLKTRGWSEAAAVAWIKSAFDKPKSVVQNEIRSRFNPNDGSELLHLIYPESVPPTYLLLYSELIEQALGVEFVGGWDFARAESLSRWQDSNPGSIRPKATRRGSKEYMKLLWLLSAKPSPLIEQGRIVSQEGPVIHYSNGVHLNSRTGEAWVNSKTHGSGTPMAVYKVVGGVLREFRAEKPSLDAAVYILGGVGADKDGTSSSTAQSVLLSNRLARSAMMKLYFFNAAGSDSFKPFGTTQTTMPPTQIRVYERTRPNEAATKL